MKIRNKKDALRRRHLRLRQRVRGTAERPRMLVAITNRHISIQIIDDDLSATLAAATTVSKAGHANVKVNEQTAVGMGQRAAEVAVAKGIKKVVLDRGGLKYGKRIKALADAARKGGLEF